MADTTAASRPHAPDCLSRIQDFDYRDCSCGATTARPVARRDPFGPDNPTGAHDIAMTKIDELIELLGHMQNKSPFGPPTTLADMFGRELLMVKASVGLHYKHAWFEEATGARTYIIKLPDTTIPPPSPHKEPW